MASMRTRLNLLFDNIAKSPQASGFGFLQGPCGRICSWNTFRKIDRRVSILFLFPIIFNKYSCLQVVEADVLPVYGIPLSGLRKRCARSRGLLSCGRFVELELGTAQNNDLS